ncbi:MAG: arginine repressor [Solirubrobacterales bacterium]
MKARRHMEIISIISSTNIATQDELCEALQRKGFDVTQATVSRDIRELKLIKAPGPNGYHYAMPGSATQTSSLEKMKRLFNDAVVSLDVSENLLVVKTLPGSAQPVASILDHAGIPEILGTVGGDDTVVVVAKPKEAAQMLLERFRAMINT